MFIYIYIYIYFPVLYSYSACLPLPHRSVVVAVVYFNLSRLLYLAFSANLGLLCMPHPGMGPLVSRPFRRMGSLLFLSGEQSQTVLSRKL